MPSVGSEILSELQRLVDAAASDRYLDFRRLAERSSLSVRTLKDAADPRKTPDALPTYRVGGKRLVKWSEFEAWMRRRKERPERIEKAVDDLIKGML